MYPLQHVIDDLRRAIERTQDRSPVDLDGVQESLESIDSELQLHREQQKEYVIPALERIADALEKIAGNCPANDPRKL